MSDVRPGASPFVEMATVTPSRRTTPLRKAVALAGSSTALTKIRRAAAACRHLAIDLGRRRRDDQPRAVQVGRAERAFLDRHAASGDVRVDVRRHHEDVGAGVDELPQLPGSDRAPTDQHHTAAGQVHE